MSLQISTASSETETDAAPQPFEPLQAALGLSSQEAEARRAAAGPNKLPEPPTTSLLVIFLRQFLSPFIYILIVAAAVSLLIGQTPSAVFIAIVLILNATIGAVQEASAQKSANALRQMVHGTARVMRDGELKTIDIEDIVPGDYVLLSSGDRVPADLSLAHSDGLSVDESMLTGESLAVEKNASVHVADDAPLAEQLNACFAGSIVTRGRGAGEVTATGLKTAIGGIAEHMSEKRVSEPPLMIRIRRFTYEIAGLILCAILLLAGLMAIRGGYDGVAMIMMGVGLAVSTIPEGLPAALTVALAIGMRRMARENVIIRKLVAVEALGSCTFICSDKTGTLTVNELTIEKAVLPSGDVFTATGAGIGPGDINGDERDRLKELCVTGILANESQLDYAKGEWASDGDIVDVAFLVFAKKLGLSLTQIHADRARRKLVPYESERAYSGSLNRSGDTETFYVKGSPEKILAASDKMLVGDREEPIDIAKIEAQFEDLARRGYRVIALGKRDKENNISDIGDADKDLKGLTFLGMTAMIDPVRPEARDAIQRCRDGGVGVAMVTGDHPSTARAIGADLGLCTEDAPVVTGAMIRQADEKGGDAIRDLVLPARVFARIEPLQKQLIVDTFMKDGHFVAVTGDGVNDAPAMRRANAGVAMGKSGTDVAKEAADLIITDDNFTSIVSGIEQGRIVYNNIRKVIALLTATGFSAILLFFLCVATGLPMPLTAVQLLWLNLVANGMQDVALAFEPKEGDELKYPPRNPSEPIFESRVIEHVLYAGSIMGVLAFSVFYYANAVGLPVEEARNTTLLLMVLFGNMHALSSRSETRSVFAASYFSNRFLAFAVPGALIAHLMAMYIPGLNSVLQISAVSLEVFAALAAVALLFLAAEELHKFIIRRRRRAK